MRPPHRPAFLCLALASAGALLGAPAALAAGPDGAALVRLMGTRAKDAFAPRGSPGMGAVVRLPAGTRGADLGLREWAPGLARLWGTPEGIVGFAAAHPSLAIEVAPPLHLLLDTAGPYVGANTASATGHRGQNVLVGVADTGIDLTHPDFIDATGHTRVAWLLDLSSPPLGKHPDLEQRFGSTDANGVVVAGAVWAQADIDALRGAAQDTSLPQDEIGHGTLVAACAAGADARYPGVAPDAGLLIAKVASANGDVGNDELLRGAAFLFDRADSMGQPVVVDLSIGTDFGPHDGTLGWEETLAGYVGPGHPGHSIVAAAGNSGSILEDPVHQSVHVSSGTTMRVPIASTAGATDGGVQLWVATRAGAHLNVGLDGPDGTWIAPVAGGHSAGKQTDDYAAGVYNGSSADQSPVPAGSYGAVVLWQGKWPKGTYAVTLSGYGTADLYLAPTGDAEVPGVNTTGFVDSVREGTINLPATNPNIIGVGCSINKRAWFSVDRVPLTLQEPGLDPAGQEPTGTFVEPADGGPCWFSSAGPTVTGLPKPDILAPGAAIIGALSGQAVPPAPSSIFTTGDCPASSPGATPKPTCQQIDANHALSFGTSFSAPLVAGAVAVLFGEDPMLTQDVILGALQGGAHRLRGAARFSDQAGAGELDVMGALAIVEQRSSPPSALPSRSASWMTLGGDVYLADGSTPLRAVLSLRAAPRAGSGAGGQAAPPADGFDAGRLAAYALVDGHPRSDRIPLERRGPGVWIATVQLPSGLGGSSLTVGATFDGADVVDPGTVPIAGDIWDADYPPRVQGGCAVVPATPAGPPGRSPAAPAAACAFAGVAALRILGRRRRGRRCALAERREPRAP